MIYEVIIVGTGPSGVGAALGFSENGIIPLILDVGHKASKVNPLNINLYDYRKKNNTFDLIIGENYEVIHHIVNKRTPSPKISSPYMQFVIKDADKLSPIDDKGASTIQSFAMGGLANAWGAGLYRCLNDELIGLPITEDDLAPYYDRLTEEIGISGADDDLTPFFGSTKNLLKPLRLSKKTEKLYSRYKKQREKLNKNGIFIGRPRLGVLSEDYHNRTACAYHNLEMWIPNLPYIYTPEFTLQKLKKDNKIIYRDSVMVNSWSKENGYIKVHAEHVGNGSRLEFKCKKLILAAGTINTAKIILNTKRDFKTRLPLLDNTLVQIPLIMPSFIGSALDKEAFALTNLNIIFSFKEINLKLQGSIIELSSPSRAVFYDMLPLAAKDNLAFIKWFLPSLLALFLYFPASMDHAGYVMLRPDNKLEVCSFPQTIDKKLLRKVILYFLRLGVFTHPWLIKSPDHSIHYGATLPMVNNPTQDYQCNAMGELHGEPGVHIVDGSLFSYIPSKNFSLTLMANAMRIADNIAKMINK